MPEHFNNTILSGLTRRRFVLGMTAAASLSALGQPATAGSSQLQGPQTLRGRHFRLEAGAQHVNYTGTERIATTINGSLPAPTLRWREGERVTLDVTNHLPVDTSIHWHGLILPSAMDGVPHISTGFNGIKPGETFRYAFDTVQSGTYWYHSHSGFQEQTGMYGAIVIDPADGDPIRADRDYVVILSDWSDEDPDDIYAHLKKQSHYYNTRERTFRDTWRDIRDNGIAAMRNDRRMWNEMRMSDRDISDVTGFTYTFLMNGRAPAEGWTGLFKKGEKIRLRFINAAAMTFFDVRIPGLKMTVIAADGQDVEPVSVDEFRMGVAETYDVLVEPDSDTAYTVFAQAIDRSGFARGTLTPDLSLQAVVPDMDPAPVLGHADMGMAHGEHHDHHAMHAQQDPRAGRAGHGSNAPVEYPATVTGPHVDMLADAPRNLIDDPGIGLRNNGRRVLTYADLRNRYCTPDPREPGRELQLHLTGNMHRYMWSIDGIRFADAEPLCFAYGERLRITLVNDTMMNHPIHLHGMWSDLETGDADHIPRKHTVIVQPGAKISYLVTADARERWAYHCHLLYHMPAMAREVVVT